MRRYLLATAALIAAVPLMPAAAQAQDRVGITLAAGGIFNVTPLPSEDFSEPMYLFSVQRVMKRYFVLDGELTYWAHTSRFDRGPHNINGPNGVIGHVERSFTMSENQYWSTGINFLVRSTGRVKVFGGAGAGFVMQDEVYSQQEFGCSAGLTCNPYVQQYSRGPFPNFRVLGGVEVPVTSRISILGTARYEDSSWESRSQEISALAGVRFGFK